MNNKVTRKEKINMLQKHLAFLLKTQIENNAALKRLNERREVAHESPESVTLDNLISLRDDTAESIEKDIVTTENALIDAGASLGLDIKMSEAERATELRAKGYHASMRTCEDDLVPLMVKVTRKPFSWQSDITIVIFSYECPRCGNRWQERDSD